jgi:hypothetical protein
MLGGRGGGGILPEDEPENYRGGLNEEPKRLLQISQQWTLLPDNHPWLPGGHFSDFSARAQQLLLEYRT